ncbi:MAG: metalloregulator ArsR/SmtB family transcription factor [Verrucomicrobia bacterium]|nr:metalloregulator ArsR/SmtB family transcription factor [Verrucomicrobiota bacterium]
MELLEIYKCLCDETRLRILNLLCVSPLCVCHLQAVLGKSQVLVSQHLAYLRERNVVTARRYQNWMIYALPSERPSALEANLQCLQDAASHHTLFREDREKLKKLMGAKDVQSLLAEGCCARLSASAAKEPGRKRVAKHGAFL